MQEITNQWINIPGFFQNGYDIDEIDNMIYGIDRRFYRCITLAFSRKINENIKGTIMLEDTLINDYYILDLSIYGGSQILGIPYTGLITKYNAEYKISIEGFVDINGNIMQKEEIIIKTLPKKEPILEYQQNDNIALEIAREGIVLLKNKDNILPLAKNKMLNIFGKGLWDFRLSMAGAGSINPRYTVNLIEAIEQHSNFRFNKELANYFIKSNMIFDQEIINEAKKVSDTAVIIITRASGEFYDNRALEGEYYLTKEEENLIKMVSENFEKTIAIINSGYPIDVKWLDKYDIKAALYCSYPGMNGSIALVEILDGRINPSGKLADTWALDYYDIPSSKNFYQAINGLPVAGTEFPYFIDTVYEEGIYVGYRYFETFNKEVAFPFGHGLSYTSFEINTYEYAYTNEEVKLKVLVKNTGKISGKEVIQLYANEPDGKLEKPKYKLVGFTKTKLLMPNESQEIILEIPLKRFASFDTNSASWIIEDGLYTLWLGNSIKNIKKVFEFYSEYKVIKKVKNIMLPPLEIKELSKLDPENTYPKGEFSGLKKELKELMPKGNRQQNIETIENDDEKIETLIKWDDVINKPELLSKFIKQLSIEELSRLCVCAGHGWGPNQSGEAGRIYKIDKYRLPDFVVSDGNCGVKIKKPNIGLPATNVLCQTWNVSLAYKAGEVIAKEAKENGIDLILAPALNIHRNPLCGRNPEYFSEDPYLAGTLAGFFSKGLEENSISSCIKHVTANNCESSRKRNHSLISERALREIYLKAFEYAIDIHNPDSIMTAYNAVNGSFCASDSELIQGIFRDEFGFEGFVMTDWGSYDSVDIVEAIKAGNCWLTPGSSDDKYVKPIIEAVNAGKIDRKRLEKNVYHLLKVVLKHSNDKKVNHD